MLMPKVISDYTKNIKIYINVPPFHHEIIVECKPVLEVLSVHMLSAWVKHQAVDINIRDLS